MEKNNANKKEENECAELVEGKRIHTTFNILAASSDVLSLVAREQGLTKTEVIDQALKIACGEFKNTTKIDNAIAQTNGYFFDRDLEKFKSMVGNAKELIAYQIAHLYVNLKDAEDRRLVFEALGLTKSLDELDAMKDVLEPARKLKGGEVIGFNKPKLANGINIVLTDLQVCYLQLIIGTDAVSEIKKMRPEKFPKSELFAETTQEPVDLFPKDDQEAEYP
jgi:hypothetical protein